MSFPRRSYLAIILLASFSSPASARTEAETIPAETQTQTATIPSREARQALFDKVVGDIERLDGDGLTIRNQRPEQWRATVARLRVAAAEAAMPASFGQVFYRLRATYPNLHAGVSLANGFEPRWMPNGAGLPITIRAEALTPTVTRPTLRVATVADAWVKAQPAIANLPSVGDPVVTINQRPVADWLRENEIFCRYPLAWQCPVDFQRNLSRGLLFWRPGEPLALTLRRGKAIVTAVINAAPIPPPANSTASASATSTFPPVPTSPCETAKPRTPEGYGLVWAGTMVCVFADPEAPDTQIWRIETFASAQSRVFDAQRDQYKSVEQETEDFYSEFWQANSAKVKHLIIDVAGNGGGEVVVRWLALLARSPFQMPYVEYKRIREFNDPNVRKALFGSSTKSLRFVDQMQRDGTFATIPEGGWLPRQQQFCFSEDTEPDVDCNAVRHAPRAHGFKGRISIVIDQFCHSACVTFARTARDLLGSRIIGLPDTGDTTFSRLQLHFGFDKDGMPITGVENTAGIVQPVGRFTVAATRTTDADGKVISAKPLMPQRTVPRLWNQTGDQWAKVVLNTALAE